VKYYGGTLSKTHEKAGQRNAELKDHFRMIFFMSSLIRNLYNFATDFDCVLLQLLSKQTVLKISAIDIENSLFKYRVSYRHLTFMIETLQLLMKSCEKFDLLFMHI